MPDVERALLSKILYSGGFAEVLQARITADFFHDDSNYEVWRWMEDHFQKYSVSPKRDALRLEFGNWDAVKVPEPLEYYIDVVRYQHKQQQTIDLLRAATEAAAESPDTALSVMSDGVIEIANDTAVTDDSEVTQSWEARLAIYEDIEDNGQHMTGIATGFPSLDTVTGGLRPEQFIVIIAPQKSFKSSLVLKVAMNAHAQSKSVLFIGFEMSNQEQLARHDAMLGGFSYNKILWGQMSLGEKERMTRRMRQQEVLPPFTFVHDMSATTTLAALTAKVIQYKPDLLVVDGVYMMDSEIDGVEPTDTKSLTKISRGLKRLAQTQKIPVIATTQALDWKWSAKKGITASAAGYTSAFGQDCDLMIGLEPPDEDNLAKMRIVAGRNAKNKLIYVEFDWDKAIFQEVPEGMAPTDALDEGDEAPQGVAGYRSRRSAVA